MKPDGTIQRPKFHPEACRSLGEQLPRLRLPEPVYTQGSRATKRLTITSGLVSDTTPAFMRRYDQESGPNPDTDCQALFTTASSAFSRSSAVV